MCTYCQCWWCSQTKCWSLQRGWRLGGFFPYELFYTYFPGYHVVGHVHFRTLPPPHTPTGVGYTQETRGNLHATIYKIAYKVTQPVRFTLFSDKQKVDLGSELLTVNERAILVSSEFGIITQFPSLALFRESYATRGDGNDYYGRRIWSGARCCRISESQHLLWWLLLLFLYTVLFFWYWFLEDIKVHLNERTEQRNNCAARYENYRECNEPDGQLYLSSLTLLVFL